MPCTLFWTGRSARPGTFRCGDRQPRGHKKALSFVAIPGERVDGHKFIPDVYAKGAACALSQQELTDPAGPYLLVEDTQQALKEAAESYRQTTWHSGYRYYRKCRKDQHQGDDSFHFKSEISCSENPGEF